MESRIPSQNQNFYLDFTTQQITNCRKSKKRGISGSSQCPLCRKEEETIQHLFLECSFSRKRWEAMVIPIAANINYNVTINQFISKWKSRYPHSLKNKQAIKRLRNNLPLFLCWKLWLARNGVIFKDNIPTVSKVTTKAWGLMVEFLTAKGVNGISISQLQEEERNWIILQ